MLDTITGHTVNWLMFLNFKPVVEVVRSVFVNVYQISNWDQGGVK